MLLNPFTTILVMYGLVMCGALALLVWAFSGRFDLSGRLFVLSEFLRLPVIVLIAAAHIAPDLRNGFTHFVISAAYLFSETAFVLSLYALSRGHGFKHAVLACSLVLLLCFLIEASRLQSPSLPFLLYSIVSGSICLFAVFICNFNINSRFQETPFWRVLKYIEGTFVLISLIRIALFFSSEGFAPMQGSTQNLLILVSLLSLLIFRYIAYLSIWMTSVPPNAQENILNRKLFRTLRERDQLLQKLSVSNRRIGVNALASSIAHQLSQPLTGAALQTESVKHNLIGQDEKSENIEALNRVSAQLKKMASLVLNLRGLFSEAPTHFRPINLVGLCEEVMELIESSRDNKNISFKMAYKENPIIFGDALQIQQVIINIVENAIYAVQSKNNLNQWITIKINQTHNHAILSVEDNGGGIDPESLPQLFELYQTTKDTGIGIGLWLCKTIIEQHSGKIYASNTASEGALFVIEIPLAESTS
jgi:signal transduction histidine kinase